MNNTIKLLLKALKGLHVYEAAITVAQTQWLMEKPTGICTDRHQAEWVEDRAVDLMSELNAELYQ